MFNLSYQPIHLDLIGGDRSNNTLKLKHDEEELAIWSIYRLAHFYINLVKFCLLLLILVQLIIL